MNLQLCEVTEDSKVLPEEQQGFRETRSGSDNLFVLTTILEKQRKLSRKLSLGFLDISKAYDFDDSVDREKLWDRI